jgi:spermidine synthase
MAFAEIGTNLWISENISPWDIYYHGITKLLAYKQTKYQEMIIAETGMYGKALILDGKWQSSTGDEFLYHEPLVHPAMIFHGHPETVLVLGGGEGATVREVIRWKTVKKVVMVDIDEEVVEACKIHLPEMHQNAFDDPRVEVLFQDALNVLDNSQNEWDIIISDLSDPIEEGPSFKLFTKEYFEKARRALKEDGYFVIQAGPVSPGEIRMHARLVKTMQTVFKNVHSYASFVPTYGSPWGFALGSSRPIPTRPEPEEIDRILREKTTGGLRMLDGTAMLGLMNNNAFVRRVIEQETQIYTLSEPPKFFGKGTLGKEEK